ncbi:hypothetical protein B0H14DRAFT_3883780 [Mycena olivaceomarginata]|nr:hypothetical protein B0H14DRAFT_3883780 [Mycena olivaceomarginata]
MPPRTNASKPKTTTRTSHAAADAAEATTPALMLDSQVAVVPATESDKTVPKELQKDPFKNQPDKTTAMDKEEDEEEDEEDEEDEEEELLESEESMSPKSESSSKKLSSSESSSSREGGGGRVTSDVRRVRVLSVAGDAPSTRRWLM